MIQKTLIAAVMVATASAGTAGTLSNGTWSPSACGTEPVIPVIEQSSAAAYNKSVKTINEWQQKANTYNACVINEANADNALIVKMANEEQNRFRAAIDKIKADIDAAKAKLDR
jgi:hypothetical protein